MIAYIIYWNEFVGSGVWTKVIAQVSAWNKNGQSVELHVLTNSKENITLPDEVVIHRYFFNGIKERISASAKLASNVRKSCPTCIYFRYDIPTKSILNLAKNFPMIVEVNTNDLIEFRRPMLKNIFNRISRHILFHRASGIVLVSAELNNILPSFALKKPVVTIANSIDLNKFRSCPPSNNTKPSFLFIASKTHYWQGIDKVLQLARLVPDSIFNLVGDLDSLPKSENVIFHGKLQSDEIEELAKSCDIGIGTLALHRKFSSEASPLKVREYLALGLPVIIAYRDTDFPEQVDFILEIDNSEDCIEKNKDLIVEFSKRWTGKRAPRESILHIGSDRKEVLRMNFMMSFSKIRSH